MSSRKIKECPFCGEEIMETAIKCRYCGEFLDKSRHSSQIQKQEKTTSTPMMPNIIPYNSGLVIDCPNCGYTGRPDKVTPGYFVLEIILWLCYIIPGLIYTVWRMCSTKTCKCPKCGNQMLSIHMYK